MEKELPQPQPTAINAPISVVWVYKAQPAVANEIEISISLVQRFLSNVHNILVCGDEVPNHPHIPSPPVKKGRFAKWIDSSRKLQAIIDDSRVTDNFLWMYDDTFIIQPLNTKDIHPPRYKEYLTHLRPQSTWRGIANLTQQHFTPCLNFSSHYPMIYNKDLLQKIIDEYQTHTKPLLIETLYGNCHPQLNPQPIPDWFQYLRHPLPNKMPGPLIKLLNIGQFNHHVKVWLNKKGLYT